jgi:four helix bundle protein
VGARKYEELEVWRLAALLRLEVYAATANVRSVRDSRFCEQLQTAASSVPANIAEGFGRFAPREFSQFLRIAKGSLAEVQNYLEEVGERGLLTVEHQHNLHVLCNRTRGTLIGLMRYLDSLPAQRRG